MLSLPPVADLVAELAARGVVLPAGPVRVDGYGDSPELSRELIALIRSGRKRAGTGLLWAYEADREPMPEAGQIEIVVDHLNEPVLVTRLTAVAIVAFDEVTADYAAIEGEGDGSLEYWRRGHWAFFSRECHRIGREPGPKMPVICSEFEVLRVVPLFAAAGYHARELVESEVPRLQALFDANPEYFIAVNGRPPNPDEAQVEFDELPPAHMSWSRRWFAGLFDDASDELVGVAIVLSDLCAEGVWHLALFLLATRLHGQGVAHGLHAALECWAVRSGAQWLRLGVVDGNARAERFWARLGYAQVRTRDGIDTGGRVNTVRVLVKPLAGFDIASYLGHVPRDRPDSTLP